MPTIDFVASDHKLEPGLPDGTLKADSTAHGTFDQGATNVITLNGIAQTAGAEAANTQVITPILGTNDYETDYDLAITDLIGLDTISQIQNKVPADWGIFTVGASVNTTNKSLFFNASAVVETGWRVLYKKQLAPGLELLIDTSFNGTFVFQAETPPQVATLEYFILDKGEAGEGWSTKILLNIKKPVLGRILGSIAGGGGLAGPGGLAGRRGGIAG